MLSKRQKAAGSPFITTWFGLFGSRDLSSSFSAGKCKDLLQIPSSDDSRRLSSHHLSFSRSNRPRDSSLLPLHSGDAQLVETLLSPWQRQKPQFPSPNTWTGRYIPILERRQNLKAKISAKRDDHLNGDVAELETTCHAVAPHRERRQILEVSGPKVLTDPVDLSPQHCNQRLKTPKLENISISFPPLSPLSSLHPWSQDCILDTTPMLERPRPPRSTSSLPWTRRADSPEIAPKKPSRKEFSWRWIQQPLPGGISGIPSTSLLAATPTLGSSSRMDDHPPTLRRDKRKLRMDLLHATPDHEIRDRVKLIPQSVRRKEICKRYPNEPRLALSQSLIDDHLILDPASSCESPNCSLANAD